MVEVTQGDIHTAALKAEQFAKLALFHLSTPRPERLEKLRVELIEALEKMGEGELPDNLR